MNHPSMFPVGTRVRYLPSLLPPRTLDPDGPYVVVGHTSAPFPGQPPWLVIADPSGHTAGQRSDWLLPFVRREKTP